MSKVVLTEGQLNDLLEQAFQAGLEVGVKVLHLEFDQDLVAELSAMIESGELQPTVASLREFLGKRG